MKKVLSITLALILAFSAFAFTAFAEEATVSKTETLVNSVLANKEFSADIVLGEDAEQELEALGTSKVTVYAKDNKLAAECKLYGFIGAKIIVSDNSAVLYLTALPFIHYDIGDLGIDVDISDGKLWDAIDDYLDFDTVKLTTSTDNEYYIESFDISSSQSGDFAFNSVFNGDNIKSVELIDKDGKQLLSLENISFSVDDSVFKAPGGFDLMAIIEKLFSFFN